MSQPHVHRILVTVAGHQVDEETVRLACRMASRARGEAKEPAQLYAVHVIDPEGNCIQLYYYMEQIGWDGKPRPAHQRRAPNKNWPESVESQSDTFADSAFQGPLD